MEKRNLRKIDYILFKRFIESGKNEIDYFGEPQNAKGELITLEDYVINFKKRRDNYLMQAQDIVSKIKEKNNWIGEVSFPNNNHIIFLNKMNL